MSCLSPIYSDCIQFTASLKARLSKLGYTSQTFEDLLVEIITKGGKDLTAEVNGLKDTIANLSGENIPAKARMFGLRTGSVDAAQIKNRYVEYVVDGQQLTYDFSKLISELPINISYLGARVEAVDNQGRKVSIQGKKNLLEVPSVPATLHFSLDLRSANGNLTLEKSVYVESDADKQATLNVRDFTVAPEDASIKDAIEALSAEATLQKQA